MERLTTSTKIDTKVELLLFSPSFEGKSVVEATLIDIKTSENDELMYVLKDDNDNEHGFSVLGINEMYKEQDEEN